MEENFFAFADWCDTTDTCPLYGQDTKKVYTELKVAKRMRALYDGSVTAATREGELVNDVYFDVRSRTHHTG